MTAVRRCSCRKGTTLRTAIEKKAHHAPSPVGMNETAFVSQTFDAALASLENSKAESIIPIDIRGRSSIGDYMIVASGRSHRHVTAVADHLLQALSQMGCKNVRVEGLEGGDWVLIDTGDIVVHIFRPEIRDFYNLEKIWINDDTEDQRASGTVH
ncbi:ribosome-associated protein [Ochrobactrum sp. AN78]|nr:ribosome-associated protein [Ochrobactrum sp. AN78]